MKWQIFAAAVCGIGALTGFAPAVHAATPSDDKDCLQPLDPQGFRVLDNRTVIITDQRRHDYKVSLQPGCVNLKFAFGLGLKSFSTSRLSCMEPDDWIVVPGGGGFPRQECRISAIVAYTPAMRHADAVAQSLDKPH